MGFAKQLDYMDMSMKLYAMVSSNRKYRYVIGRANLRFGDLLLACNRCFSVAGQPEYGISSDWPSRLNAVRCSETKVKSKKLDTNAFLLNLAEFGGGEGLIF